LCPPICIPNSKRALGLAAYGQLLNVSNSTNSETYVSYLGSFPFTIAGVAQNIVYPTLSSMSTIHGGNYLVSFDIYNPQFTGTSTGTMLFGINVNNTLASILFSTLNNTRLHGKQILAIPNPNSIITLNNYTPTGIYFNSYTGSALSAQLTVEKLSS